jgi:hypothetical protein
MGGYGSGRRYSGRDTTDDHHKLDVRSLQRGGWLKPGVPSVSRWTNRGTVRGSIGLVAGHGHITLKYRNQHFGEAWVSLEYDVLIEASPCHFGGERFWFRCPGRGCGRRVAILYCSRYFVCRHCLDLSYESQKENAEQRCDRRAWALREKTGGWGSLFDPFPPRRKGMHRQTYQRLSMRYAREVYTGTLAMESRFGMSFEDWMRQDRADA